MSEGVTVFYIDLNAVTSQYEIAGKIMRKSERNVTMQELFEWSKSLKSCTLLILDNCDEQLHTIASKDDLQRTVSKLVQSKYIKVLATSRHHVAYIEKSQLYPINELSVSHACDLLRETRPSIDDSQCADIAHLTGSAPLALRVVGALLNMPDAPSTGQIISQLNDSVIEALSPEEFQTADTVNASILLSYKYLESSEQKAGRYLSYFQGHFGKNAACAIIGSQLPNYNSPCKIPSRLVKRSLLNKVFYGRAEETYVYHRLIREFFRGTSNASELETFNMDFLKHYTIELHKLAQANLMHVQVFNSFLINRPNFRHYFNLLSSTQPGNRVREREATIIMEAAETIGNISENHILDYGFSRHETQDYLTNILSLLQDIARDLVKYFDEYDFTKVFLKLVMHLVRIEESSRSVTDPKELIKLMKRYYWVFRDDHLVPTQEYVRYHYKLASLYDQNEDHGKAKVYHEKIVRKEYNMEKCDGECSNIQLARAFAQKHDKKISSFYYGRELDLLLRTPPSQDTLKTMEMIKTLNELYMVYKAEGNMQAVNDLVEKLAEVTAIAVMNPTASVNDLDVIAKASMILQAMNFTSESEKLKDLLKAGMHEVTTLDLITLTQKQSDLDMQIFIGENAYSVTKHRSEPNLLQILLLTIGNALYESKRHKESVVYYQELVTVSPKVPTRACFRLMTMRYFDCLPFIFHLMASNTLKSFTVVYVFPWRLFEKAPKQENEYGDVINDYLSTEMTTTTTALIPLGGSQMPQQTNPKETSLNDDNFVFFLTVGTILHLCLIVVPIIVCLCCSCSQCSIFLSCIRLVVNAEQFSGRVCRFFVIALCHVMCSFIVFLVVCFIVCLYVLIAAGLSSDY